MFVGRRSVSQRWGRLHSEAQHTLEPFRATSRFAMTYHGHAYFTTKELVRNKIRMWCACVRYRKLVTPYRFRCFLVGCDK